MRGEVISSISNPKVRFATHILVRKILRKCHKDEFPMGVLFIEERCTQGIKKSWQK